MTRRDAVRVLLFERGVLRGGGRGVRCAVVDLSATGARLTLTARLPPRPLRLEFDLGGAALALEVEVRRAVPGAQVAVAFVDPPVEQLHRLIAIEQRLALAAGRVNVRERRSRRRGDEPPTTHDSAPAADR
ncbi:MAG TPA: PilZ domain-containing protein [Solirubrobacteraceae bacterium]|nr:PilZ domain-containing protein [Solirubrobacteraceae bacterium]